MKVSQKAIDEVRAVRLADEAELEAKIASEEERQRVRDRIAILLANFELRGLIFYRLERDGVSLLKCLTNIVLEEREEVKARVKRRTQLCLQKK